MIPARVAIALQEEQGWYLRSDISWLKRASMPGSERGDSWQQHRVTQCPNCGALASFKKRVCQECGWEKGNKPPAIARDRAIDTAIHSYRGDGWETQAIEGREAEKVQYVDCPGCPKCIPNDGLVLLRGNWRPSKSTERLFIFSKTNNCYCDAEAVRVASVGTHSRGYNHKNVDPGRRADVWNAMPATMNPAGRNRREMDWFYESLDDLIADLEREARRLKHLRDNGGLVMDEEGNPLALLLNPKGFKDAHFATYPVALCEPFIKAYTSEKGNCPKCGLPWVRVIAPSSEYGKKLGGRGFAEADWKEAGGGSLKGQHYQSATADYRTLGWRPQCDCDAGEPVPPIVLDPFVGSGTTCQAASKLGRRSIGVECAEEYLEMAVKRIQAGHEAYHEARKVAGLSHEVAIEGDGDVRVEQTAMWEGK